MSKFITSKLIYFIGVGVCAIGFGIANAASYTRGFDNGWDALGHGIDQNGGHIVDDKGNVVDFKDVDSSKL